MLQNWSNLATASSRFALWCYWGCTGVLCPIPFMSLITWGNPPQAPIEWGPSSFQRDANKQVWPKCIDRQSCTINMCICRLCRIIFFRYKSLNFGDFSFKFNKSITFRLNWKYLPIVNNVESQTRRQTRLQKRKRMWVDWSVFRGVFPINFSFEEFP